MNNTDKNKEDRFSDIFQRAENYLKINASWLDVYDFQCSDINHEHETYLKDFLAYILENQNRVLYVAKISGETNWRETHHDTVSGYYLTLSDAVKETKKTLKTAYEDTAIGDIDVVDVETSEKLRTVRIRSIRDMEEENYEQDRK